MPSSIQRLERARDRISFFAQHAAVTFQASQSYENSVAVVAITLATAEAWAEDHGFAIVWTPETSGYSGVLSIDGLAPFRGPVIPGTVFVSQQRLAAAQLAATARLAVAEHCGLCLAAGSSQGTDVIVEIRNTRRGRLALCSTCDGLDGADGIASMPGELPDAIYLDPMPFMEEL